MKIRTLITKRNQDVLPYWDVVFEWEDEIKEFFSCKYHNPIKSKLIRKGIAKLIRTIPFLDRFRMAGKYSFVFEMSGWRTDSVNNSSSIIPCIIDCYPNQYSVDAFRGQYNNNKVVLITSRQVFDYYQACQLPFRLLHFPVSISSKYSISSQTRFEKRYDAAIIGRPNPVLYSFLKGYAATHPAFTYVYHDNVAGKSSYFVSTGECIGSLDTREDYLSLLRKVSVGLYSTSGMDMDKQLDDKKSVDTGNFHQVTPRFLEMIACGCHIIARYEKNSDTDFFEMEKFCDNVESYEQFEMVMDAALSCAPDMAMYSEYLQKHYTNSCCCQLAGELSII